MAMLHSLEIHKDRYTLHFTLSGRAVRVYTLHSPEILQET